MRIDYETRVFDHDGLGKLGERIPVLDLSGTVGGEKFRNHSNPILFILSNVLFESIVSSTGKYKSAKANCRVRLE